MLAALALLAAQNQVDPYAGIGVPLAPGWEYLARDTAGAELYWDPSTIRQVENTVRVWIRIDHSRDRSTRVRDTRELWSYSCAEETTLALSSISYLPSGATANQITRHDTRYDYTPVIPGTLSARVMRLVCP